MPPVRRFLRQLIYGRPRPPSHRIDRILAIRRNGIGDMVCALPVLRGLKKAYPRASLTVLASRENAEIARCCEAVDRVLVYPLGGGLPLRGRTWQSWRTAKALRRMKFDIVVGISGSFSRLLAVMVYGTGAGKRVGTIPPELASDPFYYTHFRIRPPGSRLHQIETGLEILQALGIQGDPDAIGFRPPDADLTAMDEWLRSKFAGGSGHEPIVWLHISNNRPESRWDPKRFKKLAERLLSETNANLVIARAGRDRKAPVLPFRKILGDRATWFENPSLLQFAAALSRAKVVVCGDGGVMHLGAAVGSRVVALFSGTEPEIWRPRGREHVVLKRGETANQISVDEVYQAVARQLRSKARS
ncbi:MAG: glycosyltransferase family 9 protein [Verrucomicrobiae bacterium]|nr:glycosyltransferase family 9 protein [Verrucomicrobiae bacterium]